MSELDQSAVFPEKTEVTLPWRFIFAAAALWSIATRRTSSDTHDSIARECFKMSDAMMKIGREKTGMSD